MTDVTSQTEEQRPVSASRGPVSVRLRSIVLLAGGVRATSLAARVGRSVLDLPLDHSLRLLDVWRQRLSKFLEVHPLVHASPEVRILAGSTTALPTVVTGQGGLRFRADRDASRYRGTAGVLRDLCEHLAPEDHILVGTASQCPDEGQMEELLAGSRGTDGVTLGVDGTGAPIGLMLIRNGPLQELPSIGYVDLKEQALPRIAKRAAVRVVEVRGRASLSIRTTRSYLDAVRSWHCAGSLAGICSANPFEERWKSTFSLVESGAEVAQGVRIHDSVVLAGGVVESGCDVVRCVIGPGGRVGQSDRVVAELLLGSEKGSEPAAELPPGSVS